MQKKDSLPHSSCLAAATATATAASKSLNEEKPFKLDRNFKQADERRRRRRRRRKKKKSFHLFKAYLLG